MALLIYPSTRHVSTWFVACPSPHCYAPGWAVTWHEFTLAPVHITCFPVRHSGGQRHLVMAIAYGSPHFTNLFCCFDYCFALVWFGLLFFCFALVWNSARDYKVAGKEGKIGSRKSWWKGIHVIKMYSMKFSTNIKTLEMRIFNKCLFTFSVQHLL